MEELKRVARTILYAILFGVVASGSASVMAWTPAPASPPNNNVSAPLNTSSSEQDKAGELTLKGGSGTGFSTAAVEIQNTSATNPRISFHIPGIAAGQIGMTTSGLIRTYDNPGTGYANFAASDVYLSTNGRWLSQGGDNGGQFWQGGNANVPNPVTQAYTCPAGFVQQAPRWIDFSDGYAGYVYNCY